MSLESLYCAISGIQSDSTWMDVIGNNIANVNTVAYKASRAEFADSFSQALAEGTSDNPATGQGGTNPLQIGTGTRLQSIQTLFNQGVIQNTGNSLDVAIDGTGFLTVRQDNQTYYTRAGVLSLDSQGFLVDQNGGRVQGYNAVTQDNIRGMNSAANAGYAQITDAQLTLNNTNLSALQNIQIAPRMTLLPSATTEVNFTGNLDSLQQPNVLELLTPQGFTLPIGAAMAMNAPPASPGLNWVIDTNRMTIQATPDGGFELQQVNDLATYIPGTHNPPEALENGFINLGGVRILAGNYAWEQNPPIPPANQCSETVYDSTGNPHAITLQFYQVNGLGANGVNPSPGPSQVCYAWYAFDTTGGKPVTTANLLGGTGIGEGDFANDVNPFFCYDRGNAGLGYFGDFLWFNSDGSLASTGGVVGVPGPAGLVDNWQDLPRIYLPAVNFNPPRSPIPSEGAEVMAFDLNFGMAGYTQGPGEPDPGMILNAGSNGLFSDSEGSYQVVNGVDTYVPKNTVQASSQNGYPDGLLQTLNFQEDGTLLGSFSNGQNMALAQVALSQPGNLEGLSKVGDSYFASSPNAGPVETGLAGLNGLGLVRGGALENSNVDLSVELTNMIVAQRGFDSNARMVSAVDRMLQVLDNLGLGG